MHFVFTKQWGKMDFKVWLSLLLLSLICLCMLAYKVATHVNCPDIVVNAGSSISHENERPHTFFVNEQVKFVATVNNNGQIVAWDFGDRSATLMGANVLHTYNKEGNYLVTATINGKCTESVNIRIVQNSISLTGNSIPSLNPIVSNDIASIGEETVFNTTATAQSYLWSIAELPELGQQDSASAKYIFNKAGSFTVMLTLDNQTVFKKQIQVTDPLIGIGQTTQLPPASPMDEPPIPTSPLTSGDKKEEVVIAAKEEPKPEPAAAPAKVYDQLPEPAILAMLAGVAEGKKNISDFDNILCNGAGTKVMANNQPTTFAALCNELKEKKGLPLLKRKRKIQSLKVVRDNTNGNCVKIMYVEYK